MQWLAACNLERRCGLSSYPFVSAKPAFLDSQSASAQNSPLCRGLFDHLINDQLGTSAVDIVKNI